MTVGRSAPRYEGMALLYPRSKNLQSHLSEYFIVVVQLCHQMLRFTQKSTFGQLASTMSDSDLKTYQSRFDRWANTIKEEVTLLMAKKIEEEGQENSQFRALSSKFIKSESLRQELRQKLKTKLRVLNFCSTHDYETTWKQTRKVGNATLFNRTADYLDWKGQADSCTLIYSGKLGSGKSVLLANIVDDLNLHVASTNTTVAYFFCRHDISKSLKARTVIGSLARQLLRTIPDLTVVAESLDETTFALDIERTIKLLELAIPPKYKAYFVLDGLDECDNTEREQLILQLRTLQKRFALLLCVSLRLEPKNTLEVTPGRFTAPKIISIPDKNPDIDAFIDARLESCVESGNLVIGDPTLILKIRDALLEGSQGMFLWVALQIESLCTMKTDDAIRQALADLPKDLSETFSRILRRSEVSGQPYQRRILELVTVARRPLTTEELREALSVAPGDANWNPTMLPNDIYSTLMCCGSLVIVDEEELTVRLVHHCVKQFLGRFKDSTNKAFMIGSAEKRVADIVVTYLNYEVFETQLSTLVVPQIMAESVPSKIIHSTLGSSSSVRTLALKLLKSRKQPDCDIDIGKTLAEASKLFNSRPVDEFHFYSYAKSYWIQHIWYISELELLLRLFKRKVVDVNTTDEDGRTPLSWASENGYTTAVKLLLDSSNVDLNSRDNHYGLTPLSRAAGKGHEAVVKLLLDSGKADADSKDYSRRTPLSWAALNGHEAVVKLLLDSGKVDADSKDKEEGRTPLSWAAGNGHEAVVKLLLDFGKADADSKDHYSGRTALSWAAGNGHEAVVKLLLDSGKVDANSKIGRAHV